MLCLSLFEKFKEFCWLGIFFDYIYKVSLSKCMSRKQPALASVVITVKYSQDTNFKKDLLCMRNTKLMTTTKVSLNFRAIMNLMRISELNELNDLSRNECFFQWQHMCLYAYRKHFWQRHSSDEIFIWLNSAADDSLLI